MYMRALQNVRVAPTRLAPSRCVHKEMYRLLRVATLQCKDYLTIAPLWLGRGCRCPGIPVVADVLLQ
jgi:hypothetical protein